MQHPSLLARCCSAKRAVGIVTLLLLLPLLLCCLLLLSPHQEALCQTTNIATYDCNNAGKRIFIAALDNPTAKLNIDGDLDGCDVVIGSANNKVKVNQINFAGAIRGSTKIVITNVELGMVDIASTEGGVSFEQTIGTSTDTGTNSPTLSFSHISVSISSTDSFKKGTSLYMFRFTRSIQNVQSILFEDCSLSLVGLTFGTQDFKWAMIMFVDAVSNVTKTLALTNSRVRLQSVEARAASGNMMHFSGTLDRIAPSFFVDGCTIDATTVSTAPGDTSDSRYVSTRLLVFGESMSKVDSIRVSNTSFRTHTKASSPTALASRSAYVTSLISILKSVTTTGLTILISKVKIDWYDTFDIVDAQPQHGLVRTGTSGALKNASILFYDVEVRSFIASKDEGGVAVLCYMTEGFASPPPGQQQLTSKLHFSRVRFVSSGLCGNGATTHQTAFFMVAKQTVKNVDIVVSESSLDFTVPKQFPVSWLLSGTVSASNYAAAFLHFDIDVVVSNLPSVVLRHNTLTFKAQQQKIRKPAAHLIRSYCTKSWDSISYFLLDNNTLSLPERIIAEEPAATGVGVGAAAFRTSCGIDNSEMIMFRRTRVNVAELVFTAGSSMRTVVAFAELPVLNTKQVLFDSCELLVKNITAEQIGFRINMWAANRLSTCDNITVFNTSLIISAVSKKATSLTTFFIYFAAISNVGILAAIDNTNDIRRLCAPVRTTTPQVAFAFAAGAVTNLNYVSLHRNKFIFSSDRASCGAFNATSPNSVNSMLLAFLSTVTSSKNISVSYNYLDIVPPQDYQLALYVVYTKNTVTTVSESFEVKSNFMLIHGAMHPSKGVMKPFFWQCSADLTNVAAVIVSNNTLLFTAGSAGSQLMQLMVAQFAKKISNSRLVLFDNNNITARTQVTGNDGRLNAFMFFMMGHVIGGDFIVRGNVVDLEAETGDGKCEAIICIQQGYLYQLTSAVFEHNVMQIHQHDSLRYYNWSAAPETSKPKTPKLTAFLFIVQVLYKFDSMVIRSNFFNVTTYTDTRRSLVDMLLFRTPQQWQEVKNVLVSNNTVIGTVLPGLPSPSPLAGTPPPPLPPSSWLNPVTFVPSTLYRSRVVTFRHMRQIDNAAIVSNNTLLFTGCITSHQGIELVMAEALSMFEVSRVVVENNKISCKNCSFQNMNSPASAASSATLFKFTGIVSGDAQRRNTAPWWGQREFFFNNITIDTEFFAKNSSAANVEVVLADFATSLANVTSFVVQNVHINVRSETSEAYFAPVYFNKAILNFTGDFLIQDISAKVNFTSFVTAGANSGGSMKTAGLCFVGPDSDVHSRGLRSLIFRRIFYAVDMGVLLRSGALASSSSSNPSHLIISLFLSNSWLSSVSLIGLYDSFVQVTRGGITVTPLVLGPMENISLIELNNVTLKSEFVPASVLALVLTGHVSGMSYTRAPATVLRTLRVTNSHVIFPNTMSGGEAGIAYFGQDALFTPGSEEEARSPSNKNDDIGIFISNCSIRGEWVTTKQTSPGFAGIVIAIRGLDVTTTRTTTTSTTPGGATTTPTATARIVLQNTSVHANASSVEDTGHVFGILHAPDEKTHIDHLTVENSVVEAFVRKPIDPALQQRVILKHVVIAATVITNSSQDSDFEIKNISPLRDCHVKVLVEDKNNAYWVELNVFAPGKIQAPFKLQNCSVELGTFSAAGTTNHGNGGVAPPPTRPTTQLKVYEHLALVEGCRPQHQGTITSSQCNVELLDSTLICSDPRRCAHPVNVSALWIEGDPSAFSFASSSSSPSSSPQLLNITLKRNKVSSVSGCSFVSVAEKTARGRHQQVPPTVLKEFALPITFEITGNKLKNSNYADRNREYIYLAENSIGVPQEQREQQQPLLHFEDDAFVKKSSWRIGCNDYTFATQRYFTRQLYRFTSSTNFTCPIDSYSKSVSEITETVSSDKNTSTAEATISETHPTPTRSAGILSRTGPSASISATYYETKRFEIPLVTASQAVATAAAAAAGLAALPNEAAVAARTSSLMKLMSCPDSTVQTEKSKTSGGKSTKQVVGTSSSGGGKQDDGGGRGAVVEKAEERIVVPVSAYLVDPVSFPVSIFPGFQLSSAPGGYLKGALLSWAVPFVLAVMTAVYIGKRTRDAHQRQHEEDEAEKRKRGSSSRRRRRQAPSPDIDVLAGAPLLDALTRLMTATMGFWGEVVGMLLGSPGHGASSGAVFLCVCLFIVLLVVLYIRWIVKSDDDNNDNDKRRRGRTTSRSRGGRELAKEETKQPRPLVVRSMLFFPNPPTSTFQRVCREILHSSFGVFWFTGKYSWQMPSKKEKNPQVVLPSTGPLAHLGKVLVQNWGPRLRQGSSLSLSSSSPSSSAGDSTIISQSQQQQQQQPQIDRRTYFLISPYHSCFVLVINIVCIVLTGAALVAPPGDRQRCETMRVVIFVLSALSFLVTLVLRPLLVPGKLVAALLLEAAAVGFGVVALPGVVTEPEAVDAAQQACTYVLASLLFLSLLRKGIGIGLKMFSGGKSTKVSRSSAKRHITSLLDNLQLFSLTHFAGGGGNNNNNGNGDDDDDDDAVMMMSSPMLSAQDLQQQQQQQQHGDDDESDNASLLYHHHHHQYSPTTQQHDDARVVVPSPEALTVTDAAGGAASAAVSLQNLSAASSSSPSPRSAVGPTNAPPSTTTPRNRKSSKKKSNS